MVNSYQPAALELIHNKVLVISYDGDDGHYLIASVHVYDDRRIPVMTFVVRGEVAKKIIDHPDRLKLTNPDGGFVISVVRDLKTLDLGADCVCVTVSAE